MTEPDRAHPVFRHARALFVVFHIVAITALALPSAGGGMRRSAWKTPTVQAELDAWVGRLAGLGFEVEPAALEQRLWDVASTYEHARSAFLAPFTPYYRYAGTWQSWRMFVAPHRYPGRLEIEIDRGQGFQPVFVARSDEHEWLRRWLDHDRLRAATFRYSWAHYRPAREQFALWLAGQAAADFPDAEQARVSFVRYRTRTPAEVRSGVAPPETRELEQTFALEPLR